MSQVEVLVAETRRAHATDTESPTYDFAAIVSVQSTMGTVPIDEDSSRLQVHGRGRCARAPADGGVSMAHGIGGCRSRSRGNSSVVVERLIDSEARTDPGGAWLRERLLRKRRKRGKRAFRRGRGNSPTTSVGWESPKLRKGPPSKALADKHGRGDEYWDYLINAAHGAWRRTSASAADDEGTRLEGGISRSCHRSIVDCGSCSVRSSTGTLPLVKFLAGLSLRNGWAFRGRPRDAPTGRRRPREPAVGVGAEGAHTPSPWPDS